MSASAIGSSGAANAAANQNAANQKSSSSDPTDATTAYETFLNLLVTQLQHQDPLNPTDSTQFTSQLIQLSNVEQQEQTNAQLASISSALNMVGLSTGVAYLDKTVVYTGDTSPLQDGKASWSYSLDSAAENVKLTVTDSDGNVVYSADGETGAGGHSFSWDGVDADGNQHDSGNYTLTVTATDSSGNPVSGTIYGTGKVTGIDSSTGTPILLLGNAAVELAAVIGVKS